MTEMEKGERNNARRRSVVSFVRRSSTLDARLERAWNTYADDYVLRLDKGEYVLGVADTVRISREFLAQAWGEEFQADGRVIVEIGTGQGENIVAAAAAHPQDNFIGVEVYTPGVAHTVLMAGKNELRNLRMVQVNAPELLSAFEPGVVSEVWTFFPDPWPKTKHHKRRIVQDSLAQAVHAALKDDGVWRIATDIDDYALHVHEVMDARADFANDGEKTVSLATEHVSKGTADLAAQLPHADFSESERFEGRVLTNFEKKGLDAGRVIHDFTYRRV
ncbi:tRNA (guanosine(46)-N7)-methyltransferase TrmB [Alloscardovia omnicolens]|nr:tRNA (guanosine(46)-N7)-methyltransferase TrmB [Alloscardovia omnicolens]MDK6444918.1 tRNA (guanosine(46)-N7)-methyltransferase TrmB [Alloscardovia omnicolens]MDK6644223.1 tRNA (guanosine(46)-N7)-methyltransferase TrmB [Alloscardovia omnicolens]MDK6663245.1 tRNA (guanosine(46)-N7)-methyltransferase TrmB [Alloscardovia omnicolens]MDK7747264.1 tRNA (guanosine(46)-N7)-methyltransferase TrmB [Alloscardovia omnicolens]